MTVDLLAGEELAAVVDDEPAASTMSFDSVREALIAAGGKGLIIEVVYFSGEDVLDLEVHAPSGRGAPSPARPLGAGDSNPW